MSPLRQKMIDVMLVRGMSSRTHRSYLGAWTDLANRCRLRKLTQIRQCQQAIDVHDTAPPESAESGLYSMATEEKP